MASTWVNDFDSFQQSTDGGSRGAKPGGVKRVLSRKEKIQEELKLLEWHKLANQSALKSALMTTKMLKTNVPESVPLQTVEDARWIKKVIEQEHIKPLEVSKDYVLEYEKREKENQERLTAQVERHISTLKTLREKLETRAELKSRTDEYRDWQRDFSSKKQAVMIGKTLEEIEAERQAASLDLASADGPKASSMKKSKAAQAVGNSQELSNVLESLNKLAELENRITSLERDNVYEKILQQERPAVNDRTVMDFRKARVGMPDKGPVAVTYAMRPKKTSWQVKLPGQAGGAGAAAVRARQQKQGRMGGMGRNEEEGGTFMTGYDGGGMDPEERRRERVRNQALAPPGQKALRNRVQNKRGRQKEQAMGAKRHEEAMMELNKRRNEQQIQKRPARQAGGLLGAKGASAGIRSKNKHLQDFEKLKSGFKKRRGTSSSFFIVLLLLLVLTNIALLLPTTLEDMMGGGIAARAGGSGLAAIRAVSQTAPAAQGGPRSIAAKVGGMGGLTRRTDAPQRRALGANSAPNSAPPAVLGIGGVRALRQHRN